MKSPAPPRPSRPSMILILTAGFCLTTVYWFATTPAVLGRLMDATELIEAGLPPGVTMKTATKPQFLTAVCGAVKGDRKDAPAIARAAVRAHHEYAADIVATVVRCLGRQDCALVGAIVSAAIAVFPDSAAEIGDAAMAIAPDCADAVQAGTARAAGETAQDIPAEGPAAASNLVPAASLSGDGGGGGGFNPQESVVQVCDNGQQRGIGISRLHHFLKTHAGSFIGQCEVTPVTSR